jgi:hypothetical protein
MPAFFCKFSWGKQTRSTYPTSSGGSNALLKNNPSGAISSCSFGKSRSSIALLLLRPFAPLMLKKKKLVTNTTKQTVRKTQGHYQSEKTDGVPMLQLD